MCPSSPSPLMIRPVRVPRRWLPDVTNTSRSLSISTNSACCFIASCRGQATKFKPTSGTPYLYRNHSPSARLRGKTKTVLDLADGEVWQITSYCPAHELLRKDLM